VYHLTAPAQIRAELERLASNKHSENGKVHAISRSLGSRPTNSRDASGRVYTWQTEAGPVTLRKGAARANPSDLLERARASIAGFTSPESQAVAVASVLGREVGDAEIRASESDPELVIYRWTRTPIGDVELVTGGQNAQVYLAHVPGAPRDTMAAYDRVGAPTPSPGAHAQDARFFPERQAQHRQILDRALAVPSQDAPLAIVMMGGPASGKSGVLKALESGRTDFVHIDADAIKGELPEYRHGLAEGAKDAAKSVHSESGWLVDRTFDEAVAARKNLVLDGTGKDLEGYLTRIRRLRAAGYAIRLVYVRVEPHIGARRAIERSAETGRYVPDRVIEQAYAQIPANFATIAKQVDSYNVFDTSRGFPAREITSHTGGRVRVADSDLFETLIAEQAGPVGHLLPSAYATQNPRRRPVRAEQGLDLLIRSGLRRDTGELDTDRLANPRRANPIPAWQYVDLQKGDVFFKAAGGKIHIAIMTGDVSYRALGTSWSHPGMGRNFQRRDKNVEIVAEQGLISYNPAYPNMLPAPKFTKGHVWGGKSKGAIATPYALAHEFLPAVGVTLKPGTRILVMFGGGGSTVALAPDSPDAKPAVAPTAPIAPAITPEIIATPAPGWQGGGTVDIDIHSDGTIVVSGDTKPAKEIIKDWGYKWAGKHGHKFGIPNQVWYLPKSSGLSHEAAIAKAHDLEGALISAGFSTTAPSVDAEPDELVETEKIRVFARVYRKKIGTPDESTWLMLSMEPKANQFRTVLRSTIDPATLISANFPSSATLAPDLWKGEISPSAIGPSGKGFWKALAGQKLGWTNTGIPGLSLLWEIANAPIGAKLKAAATVIGTRVEDGWNTDDGVMTEAAFIGLVVPVLHLLPGLFLDQPPVEAEEVSAFVKSDVGNGFVLVDSDGGIWWTGYSIDSDVVFWFHSGHGWEQAEAQEVVPPYEVVGKYLWPAITTPEAVKALTAIYDTTVSAGDLGVFADAVSVALEPLPVEEKPKGLTELLDQPQWTTLNPLKIDIDSWKYAPLGGVIVGWIRDRLDVWPPAIVLDQPGEWYQFRQAGSDIGKYTDSPPFPHDPTPEQKKLITENYPETDWFYIGKGPQEVMRKAMMQSGGWSQQSNVHMPPKLGLPEPMPKVARFYEKLKEGSIIGAKVGDAAFFWLVNHDGTLSGQSGPGTTWPTVIGGLGPAQTLWLVRVGEGKAISSATRNNWMKQSRGVIELDLVDDPTETLGVPAATPAPVAPTPLAVVEADIPDNTLIADVQGYLWLKAHDTWFVPQHDKGWQGTEFTPEDPVAVGPLTLGQAESLTDELIAAQVLDDQAQTRWNAAAVIATPTPTAAEEPLEIGSEIVDIPTAQEVPMGGYVLDVDGDILTKASDSSGKTVGADGSVHGGVLFTLEDGWYLGKTWPSADAIKAISKSGQSHVSTAVSPGQVIELFQEANASAATAPTPSTLTTELPPAPQKYPQISAWALPPHPVWDGGVQVKLDQLTYSKPKPGGSTEGGVYVDNSGNQFLVKFQDVLRAYNEVIAAAMYRGIGVWAPDVRMGEVDGKSATVGPWEPGLVEHKTWLLDSSDPLEQWLAATYVADAWLANWDVVGANYDNLVFKSGEKLTSTSGQSDGVFSAWPNRLARIDVGGAMAYRAQGALKPAADWSENAVHSYEKMLTSGTKVKSVFGGKLKGPAYASARALMAFRLDGIDFAKVFDLLLEFVKPTPIKTKAATDLQHKLKVRAMSLIKAFGITPAVAPAAPAPPTGFQWGGQVSQFDVPAGTFLSDSSGDVLKVLGEGKAEYLKNDGTLGKGAHKQHDSNYSPYRYRGTSLAAVQAAGSASGQFWYIKSDAPVPIAAPAPAAPAPTMLPQPSVVAQTKLKNLGTTWGKLYKHLETHLMVSVADMVQGFGGSSQAWTGAFKRLIAEDMLAKKGNGYYLHPSQTPWKTAPAATPMGYGTVIEQHSPDLDSLPVGTYLADNEGDVFKVVSTTGITTTAAYIDGDRHLYAHTFQLAKKDVGPYTLLGQLTEAQLEAVGEYAADPDGGYGYWRVPLPPPALPGVAAQVEPVISAYTPPALAAAIKAKAKAKAQAVPAVPTEGAPLSNEAIGSLPDGSLLVDAEGLTWATGGGELTGVDTDNEGFSIPGASLPTLAAYGPWTLESKGTGAAGRGRGAAKSAQQLLEEAPVRALVMISSLGQPDWGRVWVKTVEGWRSVSKPGTLSASMGTKNATELLAVLKSRLPKKSWLLDAKAANLEPEELKSWREFAITSTEAPAGIELDLSGVKVQKKRRPRTSDGRKIAAGLLIFAGDFVLLAQRSMAISQGGTWGIPGGAVEAGESALVAATRETEEELGGLPPMQDTGVRLTVDYDTVRYVTVVMRASSSAPATWRPNVGQASHGAETMGFAWVPRTELHNEGGAIVWRPKLHTGLGIPSHGLDAVLAVWMEQAPAWNKAAAEMKAAEVGGGDPTPIWDAVGYAPGKGAFGLSEAKFWEAIESMPQPNPSGYTFSGVKKAPTGAKYVEYRPRLPDGSRPRIRLEVDSAAVATEQASTEMQLAVRASEMGLSSGGKKKLTAKQSFIGTAGAATRTPQSPDGVQIWAADVMPKFENVVKLILGKTKVTRHDLHKAAVLELIGLPLAQVTLEAPEQVAAIEQAPDQVKALPVGKGGLSKKQVKVVNSLYAATLAMLGTSSTGHTGAMDGAWAEKIKAKMAQALSTLKGGTSQSETAVAQWLRWISLARAAGLWPEIIDPGARVVYTGTHWTKPRQLQRITPNAETLQALQLLSDKGVYTGPTEMPIGNTTKPNRLALKVAAYAWLENQSTHGPKPPTSIPAQTSSAPMTKWGTANYTDKDAQKVPTWANEDWANVRGFPVEFRYKTPGSDASMSWGSVNAGIFNQQNFCLRANTADSWGFIMVPTVTMTGSKSYTSEYEVTYVDLGKPIPAEIVTSYYPGHTEAGTSSAHSLTKRQMNAYTLARPPYGPDWAHYNRYVLTQNPRRRNGSSARPATVIQTILFDRNDFDAGAAVEWLADHGYQAPEPDSSARYHRYRQHQPEDFFSDTFRTVELASGIKAIVAIPRPGRLRAAK
jgi:8-oxo-dGTP pyrophosphatase MutT (NUDIX family)/predicted ABC-type ATPase